MVSHLTFLLFHRFFDLFEKYGGYKSGKLKLKKPKQLQVNEVSLNIIFLLFIIKLTSQESLANLKKLSKGENIRTFYNEKWNVYLLYNRNKIFSFLNPSRLFLQKYHNLPTQILAKVSLPVLKGSAGYRPSAAGWTGPTQWLWNRGEEIQTGAAEDGSGDVSDIIQHHHLPVSSSSNRLPLYWHSFILSFFLCIFPPVAPSLIVSVKGNPVWLTPSRLQPFAFWFAHVVLIVLTSANTNHSLTPQGSLMCWFHNFLILPIFEVINGLTCDHMFPFGRRCVLHVHCSHLDSTEWQQLFYNGQQIILKMIQLALIRYERGSRNQ